MLEAMARIAPSQPSEAMARIASCRNGAISLDPSCRVKIPEKGSLDMDSNFFSKVQLDSKVRLGLKVVARDHHQSGRTQKFTFSEAAVSAGSSL
jgi:hypothetical protein